MKAVLNVETYLHCSQDLRGTQHGLWPGLSPNLHLSDYGRVARHPHAIGGKRHAMRRLLLKGRMSPRQRKIPPIMTKLYVECATMDGHKEPLRRRHSVNT